MWHRHLCFSWRALSLLSELGVRKASRISVTVLRRTALQGLPSWCCPVDHSTLGSKVFFYKSQSSRNLSSQRLNLIVVLVRVFVGIAGKTRGLIVSRRLMQEQWYLTPQVKGQGRAILGRVYMVPRRRTQVLGMFSSCRGRIHGLGTMILLFLFPPFSFSPPVLYSSFLLRSPDIDYKLTQILCIHHNPEKSSVGKKQLTVLD